MLVGSQDPRPEEWKQQVRAFPGLKDGRVKYDSGWAGLQRRHQEASNLETDLTISDIGMKDRIDEEDGCKDSLNSRQRKVGDIWKATNASS